MEGGKGKEGEGTDGVCVSGAEEGAFELDATVDDVGPGFESEDERRQRDEVCSRWVDGLVVREEGRIGCGGWVE